MEQPHLLQSNLIGFPSAYFASAAFNLTPLPTHINGVREMNDPMFKAMDNAEQAEVPQIFYEHMRVMFELDIQATIADKKTYRANFLRVIKGWLFDSNRAEGAVMKGWAESRFGLMPQFHREPITGVNDPPYFLYQTERMHPRFHNNGIFSQFDLLYEYSQYYLSRFYGSGGKQHLTLYRGTNQLEGEQQVVEKREKKLWVVRNNSLVSYSADMERASEFGDHILKVDAPFQKVLAFPQLLPGKLPKSENEYLIIGGDYVTELVDFF